MAEAVVAQLFAALKEAKSFEEASVHTLRTMLAAVERTLAASAFAPSGRVLRATVQLRPDDALRRLAVLEADVARSPMPLEPSALLNAGAGTFTISATAWRAVVAHRGPVSIDVSLGTVQEHDASGAALQPGTGREVVGTESRQRLLSRLASHVYVLPLSVPGGAVDGLISLEAECPAAAGRGFIWTEVAPLLQLLTDVSSPYLLRLPARPASAPEGDEFLPVIGATMAGLVPLLRVFAQQEETILLCGPNGAGKSRLSRWCHEQSRRRHQRFEMLDLVTVPEPLQMAELFGWRQGAFPEAVRENAGSVARAEGGTLFLDEIDRLSPQAQAGLLHLLEARTYRTLGDSGEERHADVRFVVGTNVDLRAAVRDGRFREDLYYRINVLPVRVPSLDERRDEIPGWAHFMLAQRHRESAAGGQVHLSPDGERVLAGAAWPGNLRQLDNIIRRAYMLAMVEYGGLAKDLPLDERHVAGALAYEGTPAPRALVELLQRAALCFVREAEGRASAMDLDLAEAFRGFVLGTAIQHFGREEAFRMLGRETLVKNRNHHKALRREMEKVDALLRAVGHEKSPFADLGNSEEEGGNGSAA